MTESKISVIIPTYNSLNYLKETINSVKKQKYPNYEIIIIDNYSNDLTEEYINKLNDSSIIFKKIHNYGIIAKSRNEAIRLASGKYIAFLDSDDLWHPNKLEICIEIINKNKLDFIAHKLTTKKKFLKINESKLNNIKNINFLKLYSNPNVIMNSSVVLKKNLLLKYKFNESIKYVGAEDYLLWLKIAEKKYKMQLVKKCLGYYRIHPNNYSNNIRKQMSSEINTLRFFVLNKKITKDAFLRRLSKTYYGYGRKYFLNQNYSYSKINLLKSLKLNKFNFKANLSYLFTNLYIWLIQKN